MPAVNDLQAFPADWREAQRCDQQLGETPRVPVHLRLAMVAKNNNIIKNKIKCCCTWLIDDVIIELLSNHFDTSEKGRCVLLT